MGEQVFSGQSVFPRYLRLSEKRPALGDNHGRRPSPRWADQRQKGLFRNQIQRAWRDSLLLGSGRGPEQDLRLECFQVFLKGHRLQRFDRLP